MMADGCNARQNLPRQGLCPALTGFLFYLVPRTHGLLIGQRGTIPQIFLYLQRPQPPFDMGNVCRWYPPSRPGPHDGAFQPKSAFHFR